MQRVCEGAITHYCLCKLLTREKYSDFLSLKNPIGHVCLYHCMLLFIWTCKEMPVKIIMFSEKSHIDDCYYSSKLHGWLHTSIGFICWYCVIWIHEMAGASWLWLQFCLETVTIFNGRKVFYLYVVLSVKNVSLV